MDLTNIQSDLHALQKLYGLLEDDGGVSPNAMPDMLDDKARHMLKNLLDLETKRVFKAHSEIVGRYVGESYASQQQQHEYIVNQNFPIQANLEALVKSCGEDLNDLKSSPMKEEPRLSNPGSQAAIVKQSNISFTASGWENPKKRCRICKRSVKQLKPTSFFSDQETQNLPRVNPHQHQTNNQENSFSWNWSPELDKGLPLNDQFTEPVRNMEKKIQVRDENTSYNVSCSGSTAFSVTRPASSENQTETVPKCGAETMVSIKGDDSLSKEVSEAIEEIESRILALQIDAENSGPPRKRAFQHGLANTELSHTGEHVAVESNLFRQVVNQSDLQLKNSNSPASMTRAMEIKLPNFTVNQLPKPSPQNHPMMSHIESQNFGSNAGFTSPQTHPMMSYTESQNNAGFTSVCGTLSVMRKPIVKQNSQNLNLNRVPSQNVFNEIVPSDQMPSQVSNVKRFVFPEDPTKMSKWGATALPANFPSQVNKEIKDENQVDWNERIRKFKLVDSAHKVNHPTSMVRGKRHRPRVLDYNLVQPSFSSVLYDTRVDQGQVGMMKNNKPIKPARKVFMDNEESESINSVSDSASSTNQQISTSYNESEEYSVSGGMKSNASPSTSYESEAYSLPRRNQDRYVGSTSSSENEVYSSTSGNENEIYSSTSGSRTRQLTPTSTSGSERYSSHVRPGMHHDKGETYSDDSATRGNVHARVDKSTNRNTTKKQSGKFKKLKDKLAIIFHHHHHHHHHVHQGDESDQIIQQAKTNRGKSLWKKSRKLTNPKREKESYGEQAVEQLGKSVIGGPRKNQHRHFHELVKGVLRHIRHSKKSKSSSKEAIKRLEKNQHGDKKAFKTSHWWQLLRNQKGVKMPNKAHAKLVLPNKKSHPKSFPKMK